MRIDSEQAEKIEPDDAKQCAPLQEWGHAVGRTNIPRIGELFDLEDFRLVSENAIRIGGAFATAD